MDLNRQALLNSGWEYVERVLEGVCTAFPVFVYRKDNFDICMEWFKEVFIRNNSNGKTHHGICETLEELETILKTLK